MNKIWINFKINVYAIERIVIYPITIVCTLFTFYTFIEKLLDESNIDAWITNKPLVIILLCVIVIATCQAYCYFCKHQIVEINNRKVGVWVDGYEKNMDKLLKRNVGKEKIVCVIGINDRFSMSKADGRGVHAAVLKKFYGNRKEHKRLQKDVLKQCKKKNIKPDENGRYKSGSIVTVPMRIQDSKFRNVYLMFVVNSKTEKNSVIGPAPNTFLREVFREFDEERPVKVLMPIFSARNVGHKKDDSDDYFPSCFHTLANIMFQYMEINMFKGNCHMILSIHKDELTDRKLMIGDVIQYIRQIGRMING